MEKILTLQLTPAKKQFVTFLLVGVLNTFFGYSVYALFIFLGLHYSIAVLLSTCIGVLFNFNTIGKLVFKNSNNKLLIKFIGVYTLLYFLNVSVIKMLSHFSENYYLIGLVAVFPMAMLAFILNKLFVFRNSV
jgi:putative flippase GtrA